MRSVSLVLGASVALALSATSSMPALAASGYFNTAGGNGQGHNIDHIGGGQTISPGDVVSVGFHLQVHGGNNPAATLYLVDAVASIAVACSQNGQSVGTLTVALPEGPYSFPANYNANGGWWPSNQQQDPSTYQASTVFPSRWCGGKAVYVVNNGEVYSGDLESSNNTTSVFHIQLHTAVPAANHSSNVGCTEASGQNPSPGSSACNFGWNGDVDNLTPDIHSGGSGNGGNGGGNGNGAGNNGGGNDNAGGSGGQGGDGAAGGGGSNPSTLSGEVPVPDTGGASTMLPLLALTVLASGVAVTAGVVCERRRTAPR